MSERPSGEKGDRTPEGPVPVRDLMKRVNAGAEAEEARWEGVERTFTADGVDWTVRTAGMGLYGTGSLGTARLVAVHFYREDRPDRPVREALVPAGRFPHLRAEELKTLFERATPIVLDE